MSRIGSRIDKIELAAAEPAPERWWFLFADPVRGDGIWRERGETEPFDETQIGPHDHVIRFRVRSNRTETESGESE